VLTVLLIEECSSQSCRVYRRTTLPFKYSLNLNSAHAQIGLRLRNGKNLEIHSIAIIIICFSHHDRCNDIMTLCIEIKRLIMVNLAS
jgi:hypothetical protein